MKAVAEVLREAVGDERLPQLLTDLAEAGADNHLWLEMIRRVRKAAGLPAAWTDKDEPRTLLDLLEK